MDLEGKKILFIGPKFNGYENYIFKSLESKGASVEYYQERIDNVFSHYLSKFCNILYIKLQSRHLKNIINNVAPYYDYLFLIRGELLKDDFFLKLFESTTINFKVMYQWDSIQAIPNIINITKYFDKVFSFDYEDCKKEKFNYLPLFYVDDFCNIEKTEPLYDFFFVGVYHSNRHKYISIVKDFANKKNMSVCIKMKISPLRFFFNKIFDKTFKDITFNDIIFKSISLKDAALLLKQSKIVIDVVNTKQTGLSIRTFEALGAGKKLLTNNKYIKNEDFYNSSCICDFEQLDEKFIVSTCNIERFQGYSLDSWIDKIFLIDEKKDFRMSV